ncbi:hypothetical protein QZH41_020346 [Actinostola sp. cb2023]|nr:hypothetical protein QZH41_020346 [Actinostola sp. cb2023]
MRPTFGQRNEKSADDHPTVIDEYLANEVALCRVAGPVAHPPIPQLHISSVGVIPKNGQPGKWRLIVDLSSPAGSSVNDGIDVDSFSLQYIGVDDIIKMVSKFGFGVLSAKFDVSEPCSVGPTVTDPITKSSVGGSHIASLELRCRELLLQGLQTPSTLRSYVTGQKKILYSAGHLNMALVDHSKFWAACCLAYFGFLRSAEFTIPSLKCYSAAIHLNVQDLAFDSSASPACIRVNIKASKTDPFRKGCCIYVVKAKPPLCAVEAILVYLNIRGDAPGPLFLLQSGEPLTRVLLTKWLRDIMTAAKIPGNYSSLSFRIGAATVAARNGVPDHLIQTLGR